MTAGKAAVIAIADRYLSNGFGDRLSLVELQKLAYFLQVAGEPLRLEYRAHYYGPYAENLQKALRNMEGHYTRGLGDGSNNKPETPLELLDDARASAEAFLLRCPETLKRIKRVAELIDSFETPLGMELLGTVHWVMQHEQKWEDVEQVIAGVHSWSARKKSTMKDGQIRAAWDRLRGTGWAPRV